MLAAASPAYLARHGEPRHPTDLMHHDCLSYIAGGHVAAWSFRVDGEPAPFPVRVRLTANNGVVLSQAAARGMGIVCQPDFIMADSIEAGRVVPVLADFPPPELGVYVMLPGNRQRPFRVRALIDFLANRLAASRVRPAR